MNDVLIDRLIVLLILDAFWLVTNFAWTTVHELAHLFAAKILVGARLIKLRPWPHSLNGVEVGGSVSYSYPNGIPSKIQAVMILQAPQAINVIATLLFPLAFLFSGWGFWIWSIIWSAGIMDLVGNYIGHSEGSDLARTVELLSWSRWIFHIGGSVIALISIGTWVVLAI